MSCIFCSKNVKTKSDMMTHKKNEHTEKVSVCWDIAIGNCNLGKEAHVLYHSETLKESKFKCNICKKVKTITS